MKRCIAFVMAVLLPFSVSVSVSGCNRPAAEQAASGQTVSEQAASKRAAAEQAEQEQGKAGSCPELVYQDSLELTYADQFAADYYEGGYTLLSVSDGNRYLVVPEGKEVPANLETDGLRSSPWGSSAQYKDLAFNTVFAQQNPFFRNGNRKMTGSRL